MEFSFSVFAHLHQHFPSCGAAFAALLRLTLTESEIHVNVSLNLVSDVKESLRTIRTTLKASIERSAWRKCSEKRLT